MNYRDPRLAVPLAAAYALGTLRGAARRRFESLLRGGQADDSLGAELRFWEQRLAQAAGAIAPMAPPAEAWAQIDRLLDRQLAAGVSALRQPARRLHSWRWRLGAGLAAAASLVLAFKIGERNAGSAATRLVQARATASPAQWRAMPMVVAQMQMPASRMAWLISLSPDRRQLSVVAAEDFLQVGRHSVELWLRSPARGLVPLGLLPCTRDESLSVQLPEGLGDQSQLRFTISFEPQGGSPTGQPTGPLLMSTPDRSTI
ncbi:MAG: anti-sigma factor [Nevskia sp.]